MPQMTPAQMQEARLKAEAEADVQAKRCEESFKNQQAIDAAAAGGEVKKPRRSKWDSKDTAEVKESLPDWLIDTPVEQPKNFKIIRMKAVQIRVLLGKGGETIRDICNRTGADIKVNNHKDDAEGNVSIVGDLERTEHVIRQVLASKGCPLPADICKDGQTPADLGIEMEPDLEVAVDLVGLFIGKGGENITEMRKKAGGTVFIGVQPAEPGSKFQKIQIVGDHRIKARELVKEKLAEVQQYVTRNKGGGKKANDQAAWGGGAWGNRSNDAGAAAQGGPGSGPGGSYANQAAGGPPGGFMSKAPGGPPMGMPQKDTFFYLAENELTDMVNEFMDFGLLLMGDSSGWSKQKAN